MAEKHPANSNSPEKRPVLVSMHSSSESSPSGPSDLQPFSLGRVSSSSNLSSITVPVRLDVLYFLLTSAARGAQYPLQPTSLQGGQGSFSPCQGPGASNYCCSCPSSCHGLPGSAAVHQGRVHGGYGGQSGRVVENQNSGSRWGANGQRSDGRSWAQPNQPDSSGSCRRVQFSRDSQENPRRERGGGQDNWQGRRQNFGSSWGNGRQGMTDSAPWKSRPQDWRREMLPSHCISSNGKRAQEVCHWQVSRDAPDAKRRPESAKVGWQKAQESLSFAGKTVASGPVKMALQESGEDWDTDYEKEQAIPKAPEMVPQASSSQADTSKGSEDHETESALPADSSKPKVVASLPESPSKDQESAAAREQPAVPRTDWSKDVGFVSYFKSLYSDPSGKSSSEGSTDLVIDMSRMEEEEQPSLEGTADGKKKSWE